MREERCLECEPYDSFVNSCTTAGFCEREVADAYKLGRKRGFMEAINEIEMAMYHYTFEEDSDMQKWDSGCWIRYKLFEKTVAEVIKRNEECEK